LQVGFEFAPGTGNRLFNGGLTQAKDFANLAVAKPIGIAHRKDFTGLVRELGYLEADLIDAFACQQAGKRVLFGTFEGLL